MKSAGAIFVTKEQAGIGKMGHRSRPPMSHRNRGVVDVAAIFFQND